jgi:rRNA maturation RNase YbeY
MSQNLSIRNDTRRPTPRLPFARAADAVLPGWELSLAFVGPAAARDLNERLRGKEYIPNVLSYTLGDAHGEIIICLAEAEKQAPAHGLPYRPFVLYLFIHALLHLKGFSHGAMMERWEKNILAQCTVREASCDHEQAATHRDGHRRRHLPRAGRRH